MRNLIQEIKNLFHEAWRIQETETGQVVATYHDPLSQHTYRAIFIIASGHWTMLTKDADLRDDVLDEVTSNRKTAYRFDQQVICCLTTNPKLVVFCEDCGGKGGFLKEQKRRICYSCKGLGNQVNPLLGQATFAS